MKLIVDARSREEYYKNHVKGSLNIPLFDLEYYIDFLKGKEVTIYCDTGRRARMAVEYLSDQGIKAALVPQEDLDKYEKEGKPLFCAINYLSVKPGLEKEFEEKVKELCRVTYGKKGFLGSKIFRVSTISYGGSGLQGTYKDIDVKPTKYVMLTYWTSKKAHEEFHKEPDIVEGFMALMKYLSIMPYEEYGEIIR
ncbi:MAG: rhodanese-like domain-containing protein [Candidatus Bathyarchaeota archaeon]|nr:rhodanese-like domain-containing protein [Candidatus Bathyarchaeota archaeon]MDH5746631.1 rhodanese-like domain-containing protein [Candidatus Bathyarchaeota archaeon]